MLGIGDPAYYIARTVIRPKLDGGWDDAVWRGLDAAEVDRFLSASSSHRPVTDAKVVYDEAGLYGIFRVADRYVLSTRTDYQAPVYRDAAVEFFVQPKTEAGYFHFEMNCCGTLLAGFVEDPTRTAEGFVKATRIPWEIGQTVKVYGSMGETVEPEIADAVEWRVGFFVPFTLMEHYVGDLGPVHGRVWRGNFYKCAEDNSHPHWASWASMGDELNFHLPDRFGWFVLA